MKKIMCLVLALALIVSLTACSLNSGKPIKETETKLPESTSPQSEKSSVELEKDEKKQESREESKATPVESEKEVQEEDSKDSSKDDDVISADYNITKPFPVIEENGNYFFDFTAEELIDKVNALHKKHMNEPFYFTQKPLQPIEGVPNIDEYVMAVGDNDLTLLIKTNKDNKKIEAVLIGIADQMLPAGEDNALVYAAVRSAGLLTLLDPNMSLQYAALYLVDIAIAGMFTFGEDIYIYTDQLGEIGYGVVKIDDILMLQMVPTAPEE